MDNNYRYAGNAGVVNFISGYRCPSGNQVEVDAGGGELNSSHQYGRALDFDMSTSQENYEAYVVAIYVGATSNRSYLWKRIETERVRDFAPIDPSISEIDYTAGHAQWME